MSPRIEVLEPALLGEAMPPDSPFYVRRLPIETECSQAIAQPGALVRIKGAKQMGKTSLVAQILHQAKQQGYQTAMLSFRELESTLYQDLELFLQWFCRQVGQALQLPDRLADYWDDLFGSTISCKSYFEEYLLPQLTQPLVLALDDVDQLFPYAELADEFFGLLRAWHEDAKSRELWQNLRLIVAHSADVYIPLNLHKSPFNVGLPIELPPFTLAQIQELADRYEWEGTDPSPILMSLVAGHPYLVQLALAALKQQQPQPLPPLTAATVTELYHTHLQQQWLALHPPLVTALAQVVQATAPVSLDRTIALTLQSLGLVTFQGAQVIPSCALYADYFRDRLSSPLE